uniref:Uncharacterized protein n=1 Tax=Toxocara canis TaxID=6265 RepID=A0A183VCF2_TOXCA
MCLVQRFYTLKKGMRSFCSSGYCASDSGVSCGSISLSPLYPIQTIDLHNRFGLPPEFPLASSCSGIVHHLSGPSVCALPPPYCKQRGRGYGAPCGFKNRMDPISVASGRLLLSLRL